MSSSILALMAVLSFTLILKNKRIITMVHNLLTCLACLFLSALVQEENCKTETLDKGRITVKYCLSEVIDSNGNSSLLIKDSTTTEVCIDFERHTVIERRFKTQVVYSEVLLIRSN